MMKPLFYFSAFSLGIFALASLITLLVVLYSVKYRAGKKHAFAYYFYTLLSLLCVGGALFAADYITLLLFWGMMGIPLYRLIGIDDTEGDAAQKSLLMVGGADVLMLLGVGIVTALTRSFQIGAVPLMLNHPYAIIAFLAFLAAAFAKAGVMPLHSWIPDSAKTAPATVMALLPASLDKLLGIYFLTRICFNIFMIVPNSPMSLLLLAIGSITIIAAVLGALVQHDLKKLLSFHAVSQVGYMVLGIGTGLPIGVAGGVFHMFNHAIYKSCLFLCGGSIEQKAGTTQLDKLGGLAKAMPLTFIAFLIAAFSISGVPPFNGFVSKWMVYQALLQFIKINPYWVLPLLAAMFGSAFTLASFIKLTHTVFLGQPSEGMEKVKEAPWQMWLPPLVLAGLCVIFGIFAFQVPLKYLVFPSISNYRLPGIWQPNLALGFLSVGLIFGLILYGLGHVRRITVRPPFFGGEKIDEEAIKVHGAAFYDAIRSWGMLGWISRAAERGWFDIYNWLRGISFLCSLILSWLEIVLNAFYGLLRLNLTFLLLLIIALEVAVEIFLFKLGEREILTSLAGGAAVLTLWWLVAKLRESQV